MFALDFWGLSHKKSEDCQNKWSDEAVTFVVLIPGPRQQVADQSSDGDDLRADDGKEGYLTSVHVAALRALYVTH